MPTSRNARLFYRAAKERFSDAELLFSLKHTTGAVYLAGYSVECMIKALILSAVPRSQENNILARFRGGQAHDFRWLMRLYRQHGGTGIPQQLASHFARLRNWSTAIRYSPATIQANNAKDFLNSTTEFIKWADGRLSTGGFALIMARYDRSKTPDPQVQQVLDVLAEYEALHPNALIEARRDHYDFIEIRIIDPDFQGMERISLREDKVWSLLYKLPAEIISDIMGLVLVTPEEAPHSGSSIEFDHPLPPLPILDPSSSLLSSASLSAPLETSNWDSTLLNGHDPLLSVLFSSEEAQAVKQLAESQGCGSSELIRGWVMEKLQTANHAA